MLMKIYQSLIREVPPLSPTYYGNNFRHNSHSKTITIKIGKPVARKVSVTRPYSYGLFESIIIINCVPYQ